MPTVEQGRIQSKIDDAYRQATGSHDDMMKKGTVELSNRRGRAVPIDAGSIDWTIVVVIDVPEGHPAFVPTLKVKASHPPAVVLTRRDWDFLYRHLLSNCAAVDYLHRVRGDQRVLGTEATRYGEYVIHDLGPGLPHLTVNASSSSGAQAYVPMPLPGNPVNPVDLEAHQFLRTIMEMVGSADGNTNQSELERLEMICTLDSFPVVHRTDLGEHLRAGLAAVRQHPDAAPHISHMISPVIVDNRPAVIFFGISAARSELVTHDNESATTLLYANLCATTGRADSVSIAIMLFPLSDDPEADLDMSIKMRHG